jgi:hypothetical protein
VHLDDPAETLGRGKEQSVVRAYVDSAFCVTQR